MFIFSSLLLVLVTFLPLSLAHNINLGAHSRECFHEQLHKDDKMTVTFQVGDREPGANSGNLDIDFWVRSLLLQTTPPHLPVRSSQKKKTDVSISSSHPDNNPPIHLPSY